MSYSNTADSIQRAQETRRQLEEHQKEITRLKEEKTKKDETHWKIDKRIAIVSGIVVPVVLAIIGYVVLFFKK